MPETNSHAPGPEPAATAPLAYLFMIRVGPTYSMGDLAPECELLSRRFAGEFWSYGSYEADRQIGRIRLRVVKDASTVGMLNFFSFARRVMRRASELQATRMQRIVVTSYDPFKGGLLALRVARRLHAAFVCEVNGVYGSRDNFAHVKAPLWRSIRLLQMRLVGTYVLRRADAVRLLFVDQLANFVTLRNATLVRHFFALTYTDRFYSAPEEKIILAAGFPFMRKGVDVLVEAFVRLAPRYLNWKLVLIGHLIPKELRALGVEHAQILALPGVPQEELAKWVSRCAILALVSRSEAMGRVLLEGAAAGKCRIATRVDGIPTVVEHGVDGVLVEKNNVEELCAGLAMLMDDEDLRRRFGAAGQLRVTRDFSPERYLAHFSELVAATLDAKDLAIQ
jgi:glycosyltransferase involved in cell wall biosynthesis